MNTTTTNMDTPAKQKPTKFTFTHADGRISTRSSLRPYTHVVTGMRKLEEARQYARSSAVIKANTENYEFNQLIAATPVDTCWSPGKSWCVVRQHDIESSMAFLAIYATVEDYIAAQLKAVLSKIDAVGTGEFGPEIVLQWSMTLRSAMKGSTAASWPGYAKLRVQDVPQID